MEVEVTTVDNEAQREGRGPDLLKIDAEGSDLAVLEGAEKSLGKIEVILVEAGVLCQVENSIELVLERMRQYGYGLVGIVDLNPYHNPHGVMKTGRLWLVDLVFAYKGGELFKKFIAPPL
jgi:hypothetical protein